MDRVILEGRQMKTNGCVLLFLNGRLGSFISRFFDLLWLYSFLLLLDLCLDFLFGKFYSFFLCDLFGLCFGALL